MSTAVDAKAITLKTVPAGARVKDTPLALDDVLFVTSNVKLQRMHDLAVSMPAGNYLPPVPGDCQPYRGSGLELAPYADVYPAATRPSAAPFSAQSLQTAFRLDAGTFSLPEAEKGELVTNEWGGAGMLAAPAKRTGAAGGVKIKVKLKKEKTDKDKKAKKESKKDRKRKQPEDSAGGSK